MRCKPFRWLWGLIPIAVLSGITVFVEHARIEADLQTRLQDALGRQGVRWANATFSGRDGVLVGEAPEDRDQTKAVAIARGVWGIRRIDNRTAVIEEQPNYRWSAALRDDRLRLSGFVPNESTRKAIIGAATATFPSRDIDDRMKLARGAPATDVWLGGVSFGLKQLARLNSGARVDLDGTGLVVDGETNDLSTYHGVKSALANHMPHGIKLKDDKVLPPAVEPYLWHASLAANQLQLEGYVPSERVREDLLEAAKKALPKAAIIDRMQPGSGEPKDFTGALTTVLAQLAYLEEGSIELKDDQLTVAGLATTEESAEAVRRTLESEMPESISTTHQIQVREPSIEMISPFTTAAVIDTGGVTLSGFAPSDALRAAAIEAVNAFFPGRRIDGELLVAAGAPNGWQACLNAGLLGLRRLGNGRVQMTDQVMEIVATADDGGVAEAVRGGFRAAARACDFELKVTVTAPADPDLTWRAVHGAGELLLAGDVPDAATKDELRQAAAALFPDARLVDRTRISPAQFKNWPKVAHAGLKMLAQLRAGEVSLVGRQLTLTGESPNAAIAAALRHQLSHDLVEGYSGHDLVEVRPDAMMLAEQEASRRAEADARRRAAEETKKRADAAAAEAARSADEERLRAEEERMRAEEEVRLRAEEERMRAEAERMRAEAERMRAEEEVRLRAEEERMRAEEEKRMRTEAERKAEDERQRSHAARQAEEDLRRIEAEEEAAQRTKTAALEKQQEAEVDRCQALLDSAVKAGDIKFKRASADLERMSVPTLDELAVIASACPEFIIEVEGHTDAEGTPARNKHLSERRARSVVDYLTGAGVPANRLTAIGYGETRPVAPNDTIENRAKNRRIEFAVTAN